MVKCLQVWIHKSEMELWNAVKFLQYNHGFLVSRIYMMEVTGMERVV